MVSTPSLPQVIIYDASAGAWQRFAQPLEIIATERIGEVMDCLRRVEDLVESRGLFAAGFVSYEAAPAFDPALAVREVAGFPLVWFGLFAAAESVSPPRPCRAIATPSVSKTEGSGLACPSGIDGGTVADASGYDAGACWQPSVTAEEYAAVIDRLREAIAAGETYQVNYTFRLRRPAVEAWRLFADMVQAQRAPHAAYVETERFAICSASPELFFELQGNRIVARPMKGTTARGRWLEEDLARAAALAASAKERAENAMIVDMMRNDLGRIALAGSVRVSDLFRVERYPTLWQMTSCVTAQTRASLAEIFAAAFPCASVTGAPKASTMRIIAQCEAAPRRVYTGSIGLVAPGRCARFNVAIRTAIIDKTGDGSDFRPSSRSGPRSASGENPAAAPSTAMAEYGVGGGVVWDSTSDGEYSECLLKARIVTSRQPEFSLLESMLWTPGVEHLAHLPEAEQTGNQLPGIYWLLKEHLHRLKQSAEYFGIPLDMDAVIAALEQQAIAIGSGMLRAPPGSGTRSGSGSMPHKIRLLVDCRGGITTEATPRDETSLREPVRLELAAHAVDSADVFLYHKTTHRAVYEAARRGCVEGDDVLLYNDRGEVTETCRANFAVRRGEDLLTPPVSCGLLGGTYRARLLAEGTLHERVIPLAMLDYCDELFSLNSVRGLQRATLLGRPGPKAPSHPSPRQSHTP